MTQKDKFDNISALRFPIHFHLLVSKLVNKLEVG